MEPKLLTANRFVDIKTGISYRYVLSDTEYFRPHYHDYFELFIMLDGNAIHKVNGSDIKISKNTAVFIRPHDVHDYVCIKGKKFSMLNLTFTKETAEEMFSFLGDGFPKENLLTCPLPPSVILSDKDFNSINAQLDSICAIDGQNYKLIKTSLRVFLLRFIVRYFSDFKQEQTVVPNWLEEICQKMKTNANFILGAEKMYSMTDKSREHLARSMKKYTGMTITEYINTLRLNYIANMLVNSNHSVSDIIFESGFNNISWASELFKEKYGVTMSDYRKLKESDF